MQLEKITKLRQGEAKRRYDDACGTAHGLELIGERWALLVLRELMLGPRRFSELRADLPGISANVLTQRLTELEERGLVERRQACRRPPASRSMRRPNGGWRPSRSSRRSAAGRRARPQHDPTLPISGVSILLSFRTMFDAERAPAVSTATIGFRFGDDRYFVRDRTTASSTAHRGEASAMPT